MIVPSSVIAYSASSSSKVPFGEKNADFLRIVQV
jgi:hypothetical protein